MNSKYTILIIEDEKNIAKFITNALISNGYRVLQAHSGTEGLALANSQCPDLIVLDLGLPDMDGMDIISSIRSWSDLPIVVVSARTQEKEKVHALDSGADDYIGKPFGSSELLARIRTSLRHHNRVHAGQALTKTLYQCMGLCVDFERRKITLDDQDIHLTPVEYKIVSYLAQNAGKVVTHSSLMTHVWGPYADADNKILRVNMANIRRKLENCPMEPQYIFTEVGVGYRMKEEEALKHEDESTH